jgi:hypothetical protein
MKNLLLILLLLFGKSVFAAPVSEYDMKATYLFNFIAFTTWPNLTNAESINVCLIGRDNFGQSIKTIEGKKVNGVPIAVARIASISSAKKCHLLYVSEREATNIRWVYNELVNSPVLVVTDTTVPSGAMINMYLDGQKLAFEINQMRAQAVGLQISSKLLQYSKPMLVQE